MKRINLDIYEYTDYRLFLKDCFFRLKQRSSKYSLRFLAKQLELSSFSHFQMVMNGSHNMSINLAKKVCKFLNLQKKETEFFLLLIEYCQAKTNQEQLELLKLLKQVKPFQKLHEIEFEQFEYYNDQICLALRELVSLDDFREDLRWISRKLMVKAKESEIKRAIDRLLKLGLFARDEKGRLNICHEHITTGHGFGSLALKGFYLNAFQKAAESLELDGDVRRLGGLTMSISKETYQGIIEDFQEFINKTRKRVDADKHPDQVYQLLLSLYPLTRK